MQLDAGITRPEFSSSNHGMVFKGLGNDERFLKPSMEGHFSYFTYLLPNSNNTPLLSPLFAQSDRCHHLSIFPLSSPRSHRQTLDPLPASCFFLLPDRVFVGDLGFFLAPLPFPVTFHLSNPNSSQSTHWGLHLHLFFFSFSFSFLSPISWKNTDFLDLHIHFVDKFFFRPLNWLARRKFVEDLIDASFLLFETELAIFFLKVRILGHENIFKNFSL